MKNLKLSNFLTLLLVVTSTTNGLASELLIFDKPNFVAVKGKNSLTAYYVGQSNQSRLFSDTLVNYPCTFYVKEVDFDDPIKIRAFPRPLKNWDEKPYTEGTIVTTDDIWHVQFSEIPKGCQSKLDGEQFLAKPAEVTAHETKTVLDDQGATLRIIKSETAIGIMTAKRKAAAYSETKNKFSSLDFSLAPNEIVVVIRKNGKFSLVRNVSADGKQIRMFWVDSTDLMDPYPK